jgi:hypothetical protein
MTIFCENVKTISLRKSGTNQSSGCGAASSVAVTGASRGSAVRQFRRNGETNSFVKTPINQWVGCRRRGWLAELLPIGWIARLAEQTQCR